MTPDEFRRWSSPFPDALMLVSIEGAILACNASALALFARAEPEMVGRMLHEFAPASSQEVVRASLRLWAGTGQMIYGPAVFGAQDGEPLRCEGAAVRSLTPGTSASMLVRAKRHEAAAARFVELNKKIEDLSKEIHARRRSEELVRQQREWFHVTLSSIGDAVIATDIHGRVEFLNGAAELLTGWKLADAKGLPMSEIFFILNEYTRAKTENPVDRVLQEGCVVGLANHTVLVSKDGTERPIEDSAAPIRGSSGELIGVVLVFHDVSERKKSEAELKASERRFRLWTELNVIATGVSDLEGLFLEANDALLHLLGYTRAELDAGLFNWRDLTVREHLERDAKAIAEARQRGACQPYEKDYLHKDGHRVPVIIGYALFRSPGRHPRQQTDDLAICFIVDITERKRAEELLEQRVEERTQSLKKAMADLEAFSYTVSHDLRAPLRSMRAFAEILVEDHGPSLADEAKAFLQKIMRSGDHLDRLIQDVLTYSRISKGQLPMGRIDLDTFLPDLIERYPNFREENVQIDIAPGLPPVLGNDSLLTQCFSNLIGNAIKFVPRDRNPRVSIRAEVGQRRVKVWVEDNGIGIAPADSARIFGIFERLNSAAAYEGTGIGLSIVRRAAEKMNAATGVESEPGVGSRFWIELDQA
jgi:PAS domain S-box-containing protein